MENLDFRPVLVAWARLQAEELGPKKCFRKGVGGLIRRLKDQSNTAVSDIYGPGGKMALQLLESHCRLCGKCRNAMHDELRP